MNKGNKFEDVTVMSDVEGFIRPEDIRTLIDNATFGDRIRNRLLIKTLAFTGRRVGEIVGIKVPGKKEYLGGLKPCNIDKDNNQILWSIEKKHNKEQSNTRWIPVPSELIQNLIDYTIQAGIKNDERIFPISRQRVFQIVRQTGAKAGINMVGNKKIHPHHFRHSYAVSLIRAGRPIFEIKKLMAHSTIMITEAYLKISPEDVRESANKIGEIYKKKEVSNG